MYEYNTFLLLLMVDLLTLTNLECFVATLVSLSVRLFGFVGKLTRVYGKWEVKL